MVSSRRIRRPIATSAGIRSRFTILHLASLACKSSILFSSAAAWLDWPASMASRHNLHSSTRGSTDSRDNDGLRPALKRRPPDRFINTFRYLLRERGGGALSANAAAILISPVAIRSNVSRGNMAGTFRLMPPMGRATRMVPAIEMQPHRGRLVRKWLIWLAIALSGGRAEKSSPRNRV